MFTLQPDVIRHVAATPLIYKRGESLYKKGLYRCLREEGDDGRYIYEIDGNYGTYTITVDLGGSLSDDCNCPYPERGCKHVVAILFDLLDRQRGTVGEKVEAEVQQSEYLSPQEIRAQALEDRAKRARTQEFSVQQGDMYKGDHLVTTATGYQYQVTLHDPAVPAGHCSCPDFHTNRLSTCKHLIFLSGYLKEQKGFIKRVEKERFPYVDIFWDTIKGRPRLFHQRTERELGSDLAVLLGELFDQNNLFSGDSILDLITDLDKLESYRQVRIQEPVMRKLSEAALEEELVCAAKGNGIPDFARYLNVAPYRYQEEGITFGLYKKAVLIGDEMGLGKTLQAIGLSVLKKDIFGFRTVLVVTLSSLKQQWQREIERSSNEASCIIAGTAEQRKQQYREDNSLFKITNYEAVLRDVTIISSIKPDLIILDEAQRIKNFETKTATAVKRLPRQHAIVLTGTPLENKLEDVYSLVQFLDPNLLSPLWQFAADHFLLDSKKKNEILGYTNLGSLHEKLKPLVIRRRKEEVLTELPELVVNNYFVNLRREQAEIHAGYGQSLLPLMNKKFLTPMDLRRIQALLLKMRQVCNTTYLIDRETNISPKLDELANILEELVQRNGRKVVIFSEWTTMTLLIGKHLSSAAIPFVELTGKVPVKKRQSLIDEFNDNPDCKVFLSSDAGGTGLNLQAADSVINFELPWNPAKVNQRIGRVNRIGQTSKCINVINLVARDSIEERIMAGIKLKEDLFQGVFDGGDDEVLLSRQKKQEMLEQLRGLVGDDTAGFIPETLPEEELAEDTPHFLNPQVLQDDDDFIGEESIELEADLSHGQHQDAEQEELSDASHSSEKIEEVLNQGIGFLSGVLEMATGEKLSAAEAGDKMVTVDKVTGEVTLKFKLPGLIKG